MDGATATPSQGDTTRETDGPPGSPSSTRPLVPGLPTRVVDPSGVVKRQDGVPAGSAPMDRAQRGATDIMGTIPSVAAGDEARRVFVGEGVALSGRVNTTGTLVVGGEAKVDLPRGALEVLPTGRFEGEATVERAVIAGHFEGTLRVDGDLMLAETARVRGLIRYRRLEVAQGGEIAGDVDTLSDIPEGREVSEAPEAPEGQRVAGDASAETGGIESEASARSAGRQG